MKLSDLDAEQARVVEAVERRDPTTLVLGGPGSGKTTVALWAARRFLETSSGQDDTRVLFLTFSRTAVAQIASRSPSVLGSYAPRIETLTFHGLAFRLLQSFGRYGGHGSRRLAIQGEARARLIGPVDGQLRYADLLPGAIQLLRRSERLTRLLRARWPLIICDEVQDVSAEQWDFVNCLAPPSRLLLGDAEQMIYASFIDGVSEDQFEAMRHTADTTIELISGSHRDPSGSIPALADAIRRRDFGAETIQEAIAGGRFVVRRDIESEFLAEVLTSEIRDSFASDAREVGVFAHSNASVAALGELLDQAGVDHALMGIPEAHAEALGAMVDICGLADGSRTLADVRESLAVFLTSTVRGGPPDLARGLLGQIALPGLIEDRLNELEQSMVAARDGDILNVATLAAQSWPGLGIAAGVRPWRRAAQHFGRLVHPLGSRVVNPDSLQELRGVVDASRSEALIDLDYSEYGRVRLMNYHQTKGREADVVIHVFQDNDFFGHEVEPFRHGSRLLNVAISRARRKVVVLLPPTPHPLVAPLATFATP